MTLEIPEDLEVAIELQVDALGVSPAGYICELLQRDLATALAPHPSVAPF